ncbi:class I hydrophobin superfamily [Pleurotus ostreatus PC15]|uniref:Class I hydrophobin 20 n=1 Tax=Pleurotus ostreatus (strain PC15) TaxID=1137138 RepID=HYD20_PLEO1|nr:class I hydrophobin superfamily [Pleurotus ostreatus PC15]
MLSHPMKLLFFVFALSALLAAATPVVEVRDYQQFSRVSLINFISFNKARGGDLCANGKKTMCCGELKTFDKNILGLLDGLLTTVVGLAGEILKPTGLVGLECVPITLLGNGGLSDVCKANGVCCKDLTLRAAINVGCVPINIL